MTASESATKSIISQTPGSFFAKSSAIKPIASNKPAHTKDVFVALACEIYQQNHGSLLKGELKAKETLSPAIAAGHLRSLLDEIAKNYPMLLPQSQAKSTDDIRFAALSANQFQDVILAMSNSLQSLAVKSMLENPALYASKLDSLDKVSYLQSENARSDNQLAGDFLRALANDVLICQINHKDMSGNAIWPNHQYGANLESDLSLNLSAKDGDYVMDKAIDFTKANKAKQVNMPKQRMDITVAKQMINKKRVKTEMCYFANRKEMIAQLGNLDPKAQKALLVELSLKGMSKDSSYDERAFHLMKQLDYPNPFNALFYKEQHNDHGLSPEVTRLLNSLCIQLALQEKNVLDLIEENTNELGRVDISLAKA